MCGAPLDARESLVSCRYCAATNLVTSDVAQSIAVSTNRRALFFDAQARDARARERVHAALSTRATYLGYAAGALVVAPVFTLVTALSIASAHALVVGEGTPAPAASPASSGAPAMSVAAPTPAAPKIPPPSTAAPARPRPGTTGTTKRH